MNSFIYNDLDLLEKLLVIAQASPPAELTGAALQIISNLKNQISPLKASKNPTLQDMESLNDFKNWAKNNNAAVDGNSIVENGQFDPDGLALFLADLRNRFASNPAVSESIGALIEEANQNKVLNTKLDIFPPKPVQQAATAGQPGQPGQPGQQAAGQPGQPGQPAAGRGQQPSTGQSASIQIFDGINIDFVDIYKRAVQIEQMYKKYENSGGTIERALDSATSSMNNLQLRLKRLTYKSPEKTGFACEPNDTGIEIANNIKNTFNSAIPDQEITMPTNPATKINAPGIPSHPSNDAYTYSELSQIASGLASMMVAVGNFIGILRTVPMFATNESLSSQFQMATSYKLNFNSAASKLAALHQSTGGASSPL